MLWSSDRSFRVYPTRELLAMQAKNKNPSARAHIQKKAPTQHNDFVSLMTLSWLIFLSLLCSQTVHAPAQTDGELWPFSQPWVLFWRTHVKILPISLWFDGFLICRFGWADFHFLRRHWRWIGLHSFNLLDGSGKSNIQPMMPHSTNSRRCFYDLLLDILKPGSIV